MADHVIIVTPAGGEPYVPSLVAGEFANDAWVDFTRPNSQDTITTDSAFLVKFNRPIDLTEISTANFQILRVTNTSPVETTEITGIFEEIDTTNHYDSISRQLILITTENLPALAEFFLVITGLIDTTGAVQVDDHIVLFATAGTGIEYEADTTYDIDQVIIEDYTLVTPPAPSGGTGTITTIVGCNIPDGTLNVVADTSQIELSFTETVDTSLISVLEEELDTGNTTSLDIDVEQDSGTYVVSISLPDQSTASPSELLYVRPNCIYTIDAIYTTFQFTGVLSPFYVPLNNFIPYTNAPASDPITWARFVYIISEEVYTRMGDNADWLVTNRPDAVKNFTKYMILSMSTGLTSNESFMLGELQITAGMSTSNRDNYDYKSMMELWESRLFGYGFVTRSVDVVAPRAQSYYPYSNNAKRYMERRFGTFDRRMF